jgi:hypothetical protein
MGMESRLGPMKKGLSQEKTDPIGNWVESGGGAVV